MPTQQLCWRLEKRLRRLNPVSLQTGEAASISAGEVGSTKQHSHNWPNSGGDHFNSWPVTDGIPDQGTDGTAVEAAETGPAAEAAAGQ